MTADDLKGKAVCKRGAVQARMGLEQRRGRAASSAMVTRMTEQKGFDLVAVRARRASCDSEDMAVHAPRHRATRDYENFMRSGRVDGYKGRLCAYIGYRRGAVAPRVRGQRLFPHAVDALSRAA